MTPYEGKAKRVSPEAPGAVSIFFKNDATAFNGQKHAQFEGKGALNAEISTRLFKYLATKGVKTHFLEKTGPETLRCLSVEIIPIEVVVRFAVAGSLAKRTGLPDGTPVDPPLVELYFKSDPLGDPMLNDEHVAMMKLCTPAELGEIREQARHAAGLLRTRFAAAGISLIDLKFEFGRADGKIILADEISPDTCRFHDAKTGVSLDKDTFRKDSGDLLAAYREVLTRLDRAGVH